MRITLVHPPVSILFPANQKQLEDIKQDFPLHPRQPQDIEPLLGPELRVQPQQPKISVVAVPYQHIQTDDIDMRRKTPC